MTFNSNGCSSTSPGPLANTADQLRCRHRRFVRDVKARLASHDPLPDVLVIDAEGVSDIDTTAIEQLGELLDDLAAAEIDVALARVRKPVRDMLDRSGLLERIGTDRIFLEVDDAVAAMRPSG